MAGLSQNCDVWQIVLQLCNSLFGNRTVIKSKTQKVWQTGKLWKARIGEPRMPKVEVESRIPRERRNQLLKFRITELSGWKTSFPNSLFIFSKTQSERPPGSLDLGKQSRFKPEIATPPSQDDEQSEYRHHIDRRQASFCTVQNTLR